jgi:DNA protecting protein DprA
MAAKPPAFMRPPAPMRRRTYRPPPESHTCELSDLLLRSGRTSLIDRQHLQDASRTTVFCAGDLDVLIGPAVSIVGSRAVSDLGWLLAADLARDLATADVTVISGLARGVDTAALTSAIASGGRVAAVIGTPLNRAYPVENAELQEQIYNRHMLISPFKIGRRVLRNNFPMRNRLMAAISDATVIIEASDTSGTLHQAEECVRLGRWLFIAKAVVDNALLSWPRRFLEHAKTSVLTSADDILKTIDQV